MPPIAGTLLAPFALHPVANPHHILVTALAHPPYACEAPRSMFHWIHVEEPTRMHFSDQRGVGRCDVIDAGLDESVHANGAC